jgi:hypothetical protein
VGSERRGRARGDDGDLVSVRRRDAQRGRDLLQADDTGDAEGESLDDGRGDERHVTARASDGQRDEDEPGQYSDRQDPARAVGVHDRHQDDGHRAGRSGDLQIGSAEGRRDRAGDHGRGQSGGGTQAGGDAESEGQRQRHDRHGEPGDQIAPRLTNHRGEVVAIRKQ